MIVSNNNQPPLDFFRSLMRRTDKALNADAALHEDYYVQRSGNPLEQDVYKILCDCAKHTPFENTIKLISGAKFPDIVADNLYGVEVKSTKANHWTSIGSSILESTRVEGVERIFITFGKLGKPVAFKSRPYEECLSEIAVTHYPRYQIDMELPPGKTIFDKIGIPYDKLRRMENPVKPVAQYYKSQLKPGESLWWASDEEAEESSAPAIIRLWSDLSPDEKNFYTVMGYSLFPEILQPRSTTKYHRLAIWLVKRHSILNTNIRDQFSAGGQVDIYISNVGRFHMPATFGRIERYHDLISHFILSADESQLQSCWKERISPRRLQQWCKIVSKYSENFDYTYKFLSGLFKTTY